MYAWYHFQCLFLEVSSLSQIIIFRVLLHLEFFLARRRAIKCESEYEKNCLLFKVVEMLIRRKRKVENESTLEKSWTDEGKISCEHFYTNVDFLYYETGTFRISR